MSPNFDEQFIAVCKRFYYDRVMSIVNKSGETPTVVVSEENLPMGWKNVNISNNNAQLGEKTVNIVVTNQLETLTKIDLTMQLAGYVWQDAPKEEDGKNTEDSVANGLKDEFEKAMKGIEVYIYNPDGKTLAEVYDNGALISQPIITDVIGHWVAPSLKMPQDGTYDVEFVYDGQTYEPTKVIIDDDASVKLLIPSVIIAILPEIIPAIILTINKKILLIKQNLKQEKFFYLLKKMLMTSSKNLKKRLKTRIL